VSEPDRALPAGPGREDTELGGISQHLWRRFCGPVPRHGAAPVNI